MVDTYNRQEELSKSFAEEVKCTSDAIKILNNRLNEFLEEYNVAEDEDIE